MKINKVRERERERERESTCKSKNRVLKKKIHIGNVLKPITIIFLLWGI